jgi:hypothetical protein
MIKKHAAPITESYHRSGGFSGHAESDPVRGVGLITETPLLSLHITKRGDKAKRAKRAVKRAKTRQNTDKYIINYIKIYYIYSLSPYHRREPPHLFYLCFCVYLRLFLKYCVREGARAFAAVIGDKQPIAPLPP